MKKGVALVIRNLQGKILLVKEDKGWTLPNFEVSEVESRASAAVYALRNLTGITMRSLRKDGAYLVANETLYTVFHSTVGDKVHGSSLIYDWVDEYSIPNGVGDLTKEQLKREFKNTLISF